MEEAAGIRFEKFKQPGICQAQRNLEMPVIHDDCTDGLSEHQRRLEDPPVLGVIAMEEEEIRNRLLGVVAFISQSLKRYCETGTMLKAR